jgi:mRNA interferase RelE/StbE
MKVEFRKSFIRDLRRHARDTMLLSRVQKIIQNVETIDDPLDMGDLKKLKAEGSYFRIRVNNYRIGLIIEKDTAIFVRLLDRREIYRHFP